MIELLVAFINPSIVQYLKLCSSLDEAKLCFFDPLELDKKDYLFFPLNNNRSNESGGSHWSLILLNKNKMFHYDSFKNSNHSEALSFYKKFKNYFKVETFETQNEFPQQTNCSDCGVYVLGN